MTRDLPPALMFAVAGMLDGASGTALNRGAAALTATYRGGGVSAQNMDFQAYLAARLPATFAAVDRVLEEVALRCEGFAPATLLDAGSGPGTAAWAAATRWPDLGRIALLDNNPAFLCIAKHLAEAGPEVLRQADAREGTLLQPPVSADLVIAAYALAELSEADATIAAEALWQAADAVLVIIEPGTPQGFARIAKVRTGLAARGAQIVAPCPGGVACPMSGGDWCHFSVRLPRRRVHMQAKNATVPFEDEKFSYVIATRGQGAPAGARVLAPPRQTKAEVSAKLCAEEGLTVAHVARRDGGHYKQAKKWQWGDALSDRGP